MKKNYSRKKLDLNKQTIVTLTSVEIKRIRGGTCSITYPIPCPSVPFPTCPPCPEAPPIPEDTLDTGLTLP